MHGNHMRYLLVAAGALLVGLLVAGTPVSSLLPYILLLACPLMMVFMMRSMGGHTGHHSDPQADRLLDDPAHDSEHTTADPPAHTRR